MKGGFGSLASIAASSARAAATETPGRKRPSTCTMIMPRASRRCVAGFNTIGRIASVSALRAKRARQRQPEIGRQYLHHGERLVVQNELGAQRAAIAVEEDR